MPLSAPAQGEQLAMLLQQQQGTTTRRNSPVAARDVAHFPPTVLARADEVIE
jgi:hypothetical protein